MLDRRPVVLDAEVGVFGRHEGHSGVRCASEVAGALVSRHSELAASIDLILVGAARMAGAEGIGNGLPQLIGQMIGLPGVAGTEVHAFCASSNSAVHQAALAIASGFANAALVIGLEHSLASQPRGPLQPEAGGPASSRGFTPPVFYAMCEHRYLHETGATAEAIAQVAVNNRRRGVTNPSARFRAEVTLDEVMHSRLVAEPLTLLQCCPPADGAGALLLVAPELAGDRQRCVEVIGFGAASGDADRAGLTTFPEDVEAARRAFAMAGVDPADVDVAEVHDAFTISQVIHLEDVGLVPRGEGWRHALDADPALVVNPSGGLLARGHPLGATGIAQFAGVRRHLLDASVDSKRRRFGMVQEAGGLRPMGQLLSECAVLARSGV